MTTPSSIEAARSLLRAAARVVVLTGAGVSADSGVPTFRGPDGLWRGHRPEDLATPEAFARSPETVWAWYRWRRSVVAECRPNAAHIALARWMMARDGITLVTQNVDGLHERSAVELDAEDSARVAPILLHGSLFRIRCRDCAYEREDRDAAAVGVPACPACGAPLRPAVVWFGEALPARALRLSIAAARRADACLVIGTSGVVYPAAGVAMEAVSSGARLIVIDPGETAFDPVADACVRMHAKDGVPSLLDLATTPHS